MGSDNLFLKRTLERSKRKVEIQNQKSSNWLVVCEGLETEPNYFKSAVDYINQNIEPKYKLKVHIEGKGMNTKTLVKSVDELQLNIDKYKTKIVPYGKIFVVFDKDSFSDAAFNEAISMCERNNYIPLWSNQAIEYWFLLHFNYIDVGMNRKDYSQKISEYFKQKGLIYKYQKNDKEIYKKLCQYGSLENARKNAKKIHNLHKFDSPSKSESCTTVYKFFDALDERLDELK